MLSQSIGKRTCVGESHRSINDLVMRVIEALWGNRNNRSTSLEVSPLLASAVPRWNTFCRFYLPLGKGALLPTIIAGWLQW